MWLSIVRAEAVRGPRRRWQTQSSTDDVVRGGECVCVAGWIPNDTPLLVRVCS